MTVKQDDSNQGDLLERLVAEHRALEERLRELDRHVSLTSAEQVEYSQIKKQKLRTKDRMRLLQES